MCHSPIRISSTLSSNLHVLFVPRKRTNNDKWPLIVNEPYCSQAMIDSESDVPSQRSLIAQRLSQVLSFVSFQLDGHQDDGNLIENDAFKHGVSILCNEFLHVVHVCF